MSISIETDINRRDLFTLNAKLPFVTKGFWVVACIAWAFLFYSGRANGHSILVNLLSSGVVAIGCMAVGVAISIVIVLSKANEGKGLGYHKFTLKDEGLLEETSGNTTLTKWAGIIRVLRMKNYIAIQNSPGTAHLIPKRAFISETEFESFYHDILSKSKDDA